MDRSAPGEKGKETTTIVDDLTGDDSAANLDLMRQEEAYINQIVTGFKLLGQDCQRLLKLFYYQKKSMRDIATVFNWTEATARNNKYRCLQKLKTMINKDRP